MKAGQDHRQWLHRLRAIASVASYAALTILTLGATLLMAQAWAEWITHRAS